MKIKHAGAFAAYLYNQVIGRCPSRTLRHAMLRRWLKGLGAGTGVQLHCTFLSGRNVRFGVRNVINFGCLFDGRGYEITTGSDVSIGPAATILTLGHDPRSSVFAGAGGAVTIGDHAWIGYGALVLPNIKIGEGAVVGAGAVVTRDVAPYSIVAGNPARIIGERPVGLTYQLNFKPFLV